MTATALIVDDEADLCRLMQMTLTKMGIKSDVAYDLTSAHEYLKHGHYDFCLTDMNLPDGSGLDLVKFISSQDWNMPVAVITAHGSMDIAIEALKLGAFDFVNKPLELPRLRQLIENAMKVAEEALEATVNSDNSTIQQKSPAQKMLDDRLIGEADAMQQLKKTIVKLARSQAPVFLWGASGTGKEVVARLIHDLSGRREGSFVPVNCGAIPSELMESEFFGHKKGSFTGAHTDKQGLFQQANGGTLFLDEVADLPLAMQVKLLRAIQEKTVRAIGDTKEVPVDIRILSATHKDLNTLVHSGSFRQDLFYRINVIELKLPTLRQRAADIPMLAQHFLKLIAKDWQLDDEIQLSEEALSYLQTLDFAGNVRELRNLLERAVTMSDSNNIGTNHLGQNKPTTSAHSSNTVSNSTDTPNETAQASVSQHEQNQSNQLKNPSPNQTQAKISGNSYKTSGLGFITNILPNRINSFTSASKPSITAHNPPESALQTNDNSTNSVSNNLVDDASNEMINNHQKLCHKLVQGLDTQTGIPEDGLENFLHKQEKILITNALNKTQWNKTKTASLLGMSLRSLRYRMDKLDVDANP